MSARCALLVDGEHGFADSLRDWLSESGLELAVRAEWKNELREELAPAVIFVAVDQPEKAGFVHCRRARERAPEVPIVLATATIDADELELNRQAESADACLDTRTVTREQLTAMVGRLIDPSPQVKPAQDRAGTESAPEPEPSQDGRVAQLEEEVRGLRWELDETRQAAMGAPHSRDFLRLSGVVASKEKEIVRLKKEISVREHKIATTHRTLRELSTLAASATRERKQISGHVGQLGRDLEKAQAEALKLRVDATRQAEAAARATTRLEEERRRHAATRQRHDAMLEEHTAALESLEQKHAKALVELDEDLGRVKDEALRAQFGKWRKRLKRRRREQLHALALLEDRLRNLEAAHEQARARSEDEHRSALRASEERLTTEAERRLSEQQQQHESALAEALSAHAAAESRAEQQRAAERATVAKLEQEKTAAITAAREELERTLDEVRAGGAASLKELRQHFEGQLDFLRRSREQERVEELGVHEIALRDAEQELAAARGRSERREQELCEKHERELNELRARHLETSSALENGLRREHEEALAAAAAEWERKLEELGRHHATSAETLRQRFHEQLETLQASTAEELARRGDEHETARRGDAEELSTVRARAAQHDQEARERHTQELARAEARHVEALTALTSRLQEEREQAVSATVGAWEAKLEEQRRRFLDQVAMLQASQKRELAERVAEREAAVAQAAESRAAERASAETRREELVERYERQLEEIRAERDGADRRAEHDRHSALEALETRLRDERDRAAAAAAAEWEGRLEQLRRSHSSSIEILRQESRDRLEALRASAAKDAAQRAAQHQAAIAGMREALAAARSEAADLDKQTREHYELELARVEAGHREALAAAETRLRGERDELVAATVNSWERKLAELVAGHADSLETVRREHREQLGARDATRKQDLARREAEALTALEARWRKERDQAVATAVAEWKAKMDRLRRGHADTVAALRREHQDQLDALQNARQQGPASHPPSADPSGEVVAWKAASGEPTR